MLLPAFAAMVLAYREHITQSDEIIQFMRSHYGLFDENKKIWRQEPNSEHDVIDTQAYEVCAENFGARSEKVVLLAVCSVPDEPDGAHGDSGLIELYAIDRSTGQLNVVASLKTDGIGSHGHPGDVKVVQLGKSFWGFQVEGGGIWQGTVVSSIVIYVPQKNSFKEAMAIRSTLNNFGSLSCKACQSTGVNIERSVEIVADGKSKIYPLRIVESGERHGHVVKNTYEAKFDARKWSYIYPRAIDVTEDN